MKEEMVEWTLKLQAAGAIVRLLGPLSSILSTLIGSSSPGFQIREVPITCDVSLLLEVPGIEPESICRQSMPGSPFTGMQ